MSRISLPVARIVAGLLAAFMAAYFATDNFGGSPVRTLSNPFLVPDLLIVVLLGIAAVLPRRLAGPALIFGLAWSAAVWALSLSHWLVDGELIRGLGHLAMILPAIIAAALVAAGTGKAPRTAHDQVK